MKKLCYYVASLMWLGCIVLSCKKDDSAPVADCNTSGLSVTGTATNASCNTNNGTITATGSGGKSPYQYSINGNTFQTATDFTDLPAGDFTLTVKDAAGCTTNIQGIQVGVNPSTISFESNIKTIISTNCAIGSCHVAGGNAPGDFSQFANLKARAAQVKIRTGNKTMPMGRTLTDEQIKLIACWVDAGSPNN